MKNKITLKNLIESKYRDHPDNAILDLTIRHDTETDELIFMADGLDTNYRSFIVKLTDSSDDKLWSTIDILHLIPTYSPNFKVISFTESNMHDSKPDNFRYLNINIVIVDTSRCNYDNIEFIVDGPFTESIYTFSIIDKLTGVVYSIFDSMFLQIFKAVDPKIKAALANYAEMHFKNLEERLNLTKSFVQGCFNSLSDEEKLQIEIYKSEV